MELYLMQHGLALSAEEDAERPLSPVGIAQVKASAAGLKALSLAFDLICASPKRRAQQTAALVAEALRYPYSDILATETLLPNADPAHFLELLQRESNCPRVLAVGHLPNLDTLAKGLLGGGRLRFENAGLVGLQQAEADGPSTLFCLLTPDQLACLHK